MDYPLLLITIITTFGEKKLKTLEILNRKKMRSLDVFKRKYFFVQFILNFSVFLLFAEFLVFTFHRSLNSETSECVGLRVRDLRLPDYLRLLTQNNSLSLHLSRCEIPTRAILPLRDIAPRSINQIV